MLFRGHPGFPKDGLKLKNGSPIEGVVGEVISIPHPEGGSITFKNPKLATRIKRLHEDAKALYLQLVDFAEKSAKLNARVFEFQLQCPFFMQQLDALPAARREPIAAHLIHEQEENLRAVYRPLLAAYE